MKDNRKQQYCFFVGNFVCGAIIIISCVDVKLY